MGQSHTLLLTKKLDNRLISGTGRSRAMGEQGLWWVGRSDNPFLTKEKENMVYCGRDEVTLVYLDVLIL